MLLLIISKYRVVALPGELGDLADKVEAVGALFCGVVNVDQTDIMPQRHTLVSILGVNRVKTIFRGVVFSLVVQAHILVRTKRALAGQTLAAGVVEGDKLFFCHDDKSVSQMQFCYSMTSIAGGN